MDESATAIETPRRNVRRKLIQSTLFPHKSEDVIESNGDRVCDAGIKEEGDGGFCSSQGKKTRKQRTPKTNGASKKDVIESAGDRTCLAGNKEEGEGEEGGDGDFCSSQGKKTRKQRTPKKNGAPSKMAKGKSPRKSTPKKNVAKNGTVATDDHINVSLAVPNLRLEAKLRAEEDSRRSAGKQVHPFFSSWKGGKKNQEAAAAVAENGGCNEQGKDKIVTTIGPIHVFERFEDVNRTIDWKNWTFVEQPSTTWTPGEPIKSDSLTHRLKEFDLNELPVLSHPDVCVTIDDEEPVQCVTQSEGIAAASPVVFISYQEASDKAEVVDCEAHEAVNLSNRVGGVPDFSHELQSMSSCRESGQPRNSLWVDKYQPRSASEVCGNTESVKLMNEWLGQWHERGFQPSKDFLCSDEEKSEDADYNCSESDSDSENIGAEDRLKNVLLIVGPVGSGKSAAVHACAKEQGFKILESNASECRSGAVVRQKFGEALKSYSLSRSLEPLFNSCTDGNGVEDVIEVAPVLHIQNDRANLKPLILFEDVDISFGEDRGLVSAIQQIAEKAKGPVVLTANDKNHGLPDSLERIEVCFSLPSIEELFSHLSSVCAAEEAIVDPCSLEQLTIFCSGDIRKSLMQSQFWFQSKSGRARKAKNTADPYSFDHEAGHALLPKIISRDFPSQLSQFVESEIAKSLSMAEESYNAVEIFVEEVENEKMLSRYWRQGTEKNSIEAKKAAMLRQNTCAEDYDELEDVLSGPFELNNTSYQELSFSRPNRRRKLNVVMSSDSEDEPVTEAELLETSCYQYETSKLSCVNEVSQTVDISCVPESSYVPETLMDSEADLSPRAVSCGHFDGRGEVSMSEDVAQSKEIYIDRFQSFDCLKNTCENIAESSDGTMMEDCFKEYVGSSSQKMQQVTDECSRIDFGMTLKTAEKPKFDTVQESWNKLCLSHTDLKPYLDSEPVEAPQVLDLTHQITNLISEADLTHSRCLNLVAMEPMMNVSGDLDTSGYVLEQMTSTVAEQGFRFFTNQIASTGSFPTSSATMVPGEGLGVVDETKQDYTWSSGSCLDVKPETHIDVSKRERMVQLSSILESVVPLRSLRGRAFHEYASYIGQISRVNPSNLSVAMESSRRRRSRESRHYLSMDLSSEDIAFLGQQNTYRRREEMNN
ncbi:p-loop containing nucleoside triphosphate hydrolases superfamily protein [Hirschfeldia incana]|nr:p-loop containing nucleoside triphosphate hydrolases superfamily protein [Hirschfeldia incana]